MNNEQKTLIILTPGFPGSENDSTCLPLQQQLVLSVKKINRSLDIIVLSFQYPYHVKTYKWHDITVMSFNGRNKGGISKLLLRKKINRALRNIAKNKNVIGLLSFWYNECAWAGKKFGKKLNVKHYCWILGQDAKKENKYPAKLHPGADELIALSDFIQDEFERNHGVRPATVISPGVSPAPNSSPIEKDIDVLAAGSLIALKQYDIFIEAVAEIKKTFPNIKGMLIGEGPEKERLQGLISKLGLENNILLAGELPHDEVLKWMKRAKVFLHPSSYEGFGLVCLEALANEAKVVSFIKPMKEEIKNWHIVNDREELQRKVIELLQKDDHYQKIIPFTIESTAEKMMRLFQ